MIFEERKRNKYCPHCLSIPITLSQSCQQQSQNFLVNISLYNHTYILSGSGQMSLFIIYVTILIIDKLCIAIGHNDLAFQKIQNHLSATFKSSFRNPLAIKYQNPIFATFNPPKFALPCISLSHIFYNNISLIHVFVIFRIHPSLLYLECTSLSCMIF